MAEIVLFHSAAGLRPAVLRAAERLRAGGHSVTTPDLYDGASFTVLDEGVAQMEAIGWEGLVACAEAAVADLPRELVLMGMSMGAGLAATIATTRPGARGVVLLYGPEVPEEPWPAGVPVQAHHSAGDPWVDEGAAARLLDTMAAAGVPVSVHVYPGSGHLLDHDDMPDQHDPVAAPLIWSRVEGFLAELQP